MTTRDDEEFPEALVAVGRLFGLSEVQARWKLRLLARRYNALRERLAGSERRFEHRLCLECGRVRDRDEAACGACGARKPSRAVELARRVGLVVPSAMSVSAVLGLAMVLVYGRMILAHPGEGILSWNLATLVEFGAHHPPAVAAGQIWRLGTAIFLHIGLWHLGFNLIALCQIGPAVEEIFGRGRMLFLFMATGVLASIGSAMLGLDGVSAGASGAIMGLIGVAAGWGHRVGTSLGRDVRDRMIKWGIYTMGFGLFVGADHGAHAVGLSSGALLGWLFDPDRLERTRRSASSMTMAFFGAAAAAAVVVLALAPPASARTMGQQWREAQEQPMPIEAFDEAPDAAWAALCDHHARGDAAGVAEAWRRLVGSEADAPTSEQLGLMCAGFVGR